MKAKNNLFDGLFGAYVVATLLCMRFTVVVRLVLFWKFGGIQNTKRAKTVGSLRKIDNSYQLVFVRRFWIRLKVSDQGKSCNFNPTYCTFQTTQLAANHSTVNSMIN